MTYEQLEKQELDEYDGNSVNLPLFMLGEYFFG